MWLVSVPSWHKHTYWKSVTDSSELYKSLLERNKAQLLKSVDSPFTTGLIADNVERHGEGTVTYLILEGSYNLESLDIKEVDCSREID